MARSAGSTSSTSDPLTPARRVRVGVVVGAHGLDGELRVRLLGAAAEDFQGARTLWLARDESDAAAAAYALERVAPGRAGECRVRLTGVGGRAAAEAASGLWLLARADELARPQPGEYYLYELEGCKVEDRDGRALGVVRGVWSTGGSDVLVLEDAHGREQLLPAVRALLVEVDVAARRIVVEAPPGLFEGGG
jgi:16S rRNA processing protein RimM